MYWAVTMLCLGLCLGFLVWASADVGSGVYLKTLCRKQTGRPVVALTFDDGPDERMTPRVLDVLKRHRIRAAFFLTGEKAERHPQLVRRIVGEGHIVGNHTYSHAPFFPLWSRKRVEQEIRAAQESIRKTAGVTPRLFRPPFGVTNPIIGRAVRNAGLQGIGWSIRSLDTLEGQERQAVCDRIRRQLHNGAVILLHDRCERADELLEQVVTAIRSSGREPVGIDELFEIKSYEN